MTARKTNQIQTEARRAFRKRELQNEAEALAVDAAPTITHPCLTKQHLYVGMACWAAWGATGWVPVKVLRVSGAQKKVAVAPVDPRTNAPTGKSRRVRIDRLVNRRPSLKGKDRPEKPPLELLPDAFLENDPPDGNVERQIEAETPRAPQASPATPARQPVARDPRKIGKLLDLIPDDHVGDRW